MAAASRLELAQRVRDHRLGDAERPADVAGPSEDLVADLDLRESQHTFHASDVRDADAPEPDRHELARPELQDALEARADLVFGIVLGFEDREGRRAGTERRGLTHVNPVVLFGSTRDTPS